MTTPKRKTPKKKAAADPDRRLEVEIYHKEFAAAQAYLGEGHPLSRLTVPQLEHILDEFGRAADVLKYHGISVFGCYGAAALQVLTDPDKGPIRIGNMAGHGSFTGSSTPFGDYNFGDDLKRGPRR